MYVHACMRARACVCVLARARVIVYVESHNHDFLNDIMFLNMRKDESITFNVELGLNREHIYTIAEDNIYECIINIKLQRKNRHIWKMATYKIES